ncbi:MAG: hypothetical protein ABI862_16110, partial [Ilumatobacteraceae bacterium]
MSLMLITSTPRIGPHMTAPTELAIVFTSFEDLYVREYPGLIAVATALSGYNGEDLVQAAMLRVILCRSRRRRRATETRFLSRLRRGIRQHRGARWIRLSRDRQRVR